MYRFLITSAVVFMFLGGSPSAGQVSGVVALLNLETGEQIERLLSSRESGVSPIIGVSRLLSHDQILKLYQGRGFTPLWLDGWQLKPGSLVLLANLRDAGLVETRRESQVIHYRLNSPAVSEILETLYCIYCNPTMRSG